MDVQVVGSGGLAVAMFAFTAVGLLLLGYKNFKDPSNSEEGLPPSLPSNSFDQK